MLPLVGNHQSQPLVKRIPKALDASGNKSVSDFLNKNSRSSYRQYQKQKPNHDQIPVQKLFFNHRESSTRETPQSLFLTKHVEPQITKAQSTLDESKYQDRIDFHSRKQRFDQYAAERRLMNSFKSFRLQANCAQRPSITAAKSRRSIVEVPSQQGRRILIVNQLFMNTNTIQYNFMSIPDHTCSDKSKFTVDFVNELRNRMKINGKKLYFFLKDGTPVYSHLDIPNSEKVLIYSTSPVYKQIYNHQVNELEQYCPTEGYDNIPQKPKPDYSHYVDDIVNTLVRQNYKSMDDVVTGENADDEIDAGEKFLNSKELKHSLRAIKRDGNFKPILQRMFQEKPEGHVQKNRFKDYMSQQLIISNKKIEDLERIERWYDKELKKIDFNAELEGDINQVHVEEHTDPDDTNIQIKKVAQLLEPLLEKHLKMKSRAEKQEQEEEGVEVNFNNEEEEAPVQKKFARINVDRLQTKKDCLSKLLRINRELFIQNIPKLLTKSTFSQYELHHSYILYCALQQITSQRYHHYNCEDGLDYGTYRKGIYQIFMQSEFLAQEIFNRIDLNYSGFLNWNEFLDLMVSIRAKTLVEKIDLFIHISDTDGNGMLSYDEIFKLSKVCLSKYVVNSEDFLEMLCEYYTRLIFKVVGKEVEEEIPFEDIKQAILEGREDSDLLCMFCGADI